MTINDILVLLGRDLDTTFSLNKNGNCAFTFEDTIDVYFKNDQKHKRFYAHCEICELQNNVDPVFYEILLETHLLGQGTNGCLFGISQDAKKIILFKIFIDDEFDYESFLTDFQLLVKTSLVFQKKLFTIYKNEVAQENTIIPLKSIKV